MSHGPATPAEHAARVLKERYASSKYTDLSVQRTLLALLTLNFEQDMQIKHLKRELDEARRGK